MHSYYSHSNDFNKIFVFFFFYESLYRTGYNAVVLVFLPFFFYYYVIFLPSNIFIELILYVKLVDLKFITIMYNIITQVF